MRIAMIGQKGIPATFGGVERHVEDLSATLAKRGHDVTVYTRPHYTNRLRKTYRGVHLVSLPSIHTKHLDAISHTLFATIHALRTHPDIMHYHGVGPALLSFLPRIFAPRVKVIVTFHCLDRKHDKWGWFARMMLRLGERAALTFPHQTIVTSKVLQRYCMAVYGKSPMYVPSGISNMFLNERRVSLIERTFGLHRNGYIFAAARFIPHKGLHHLIAAFRQTRTNKKLVIAGDAFFTNTYARRLKELAEGDNRILFTGFQHGRALTELFANAYLFVLPSETEGQSLALLEAAGSGTCILASNIPENMEVIRQGSKAIGYAFRNKDARDLQKRLSELLRTPAQVRERGTEAKSVARTQFNWKNVARSVERVYVQA